MPDPSQVGPELIPKTVKVAPPPLRTGAPAPSAAPEAQHEVVISVRHLNVGFGDKVILHDLDLDVYRGEILGFVGGSGTGKSVLTRTILGLVPKQGGQIEVFGKDLDQMAPQEHRLMEREWGVLFQQGALFSGLSVRQNIQVAMREYLKLSQELMDELAMLKIAMVGLKPGDAEKFPYELSGGMIKRVALARALALDPQILFLDEPTSGLDPIGAGEFDQLLRTLQRTLGLTVFMVTHDLDSLYSVCDRIAALADQHVIAAGPIDVLLKSDHPWLQAYFHGDRARTRDIARQYEKTASKAPAQP